MNKKFIWIIALVVLVFGVVAAIVVNNQKTTAPDSQSNKKSTYDAPKACDILTAGLAQKIDAGLTANESPDSGASSDAISVSNCNYYSVSTRVSVGLLVRAAKSDIGAKSNSDQFVTLPPGSEPVEGYGDRAYWDPSFGQLNILKNNNWYILSSGPVVAKDRTLADTKKLADLIADKL